MYNLTRTWIQLLITSLNADLTTAGKDNLKEIDTNLDINFLPANLKNATYVIKFSELEAGEKENDIFNGIDVKIEFLFALYQKDITQYQDFVDTYLYPLKRLLQDDNAPLPYSNAAVSTRESLEHIKDLKITNLDKLDNGGKYLIPQISFTLEVIDDNSANISLPAVPTLTLPADTGTVTTANPQFNWTGTADYYVFELASDSAFTTLIASEAKLNNTSYTLPADFTLTNLTTYYWRVRGKSNYGVSAWVTRSFTTSITGAVVAKDPSQVGLTDLWVRGDLLTLAGAKVSSWTDKSGNGRHLTNATDANRPITEVLSGNTFVKFEGTNAIVNNLSVEDGAGVFSMDATKTRSFVWTFKDGTNSLHWAQTLFARSNNSVGNEYDIRSYEGDYEYFGYPSNAIYTGVGQAIFPRQKGNIIQVVMVIKNLTSKIYINGTLVHICSVNLNYQGVPLPNNSATLFIIGGGRQTIVNQGTFNGSVWEFATGAVELTQGNVDSLYKYHKDTFGL